MECKKCKAQLEQGVKICPECGTDNTAEQPGGILLTPGKLVAIIAVVVLLTAAVVALILNGMGFSFSTAATEPVNVYDPVVDFTEPTEPVYTIPADGNPDDVTCKGSYTVSDEEILADMDNVVATVGDRQLTNAELQIYYWLEVQSFLSNYGSYISFVGLDYTKPLDTQICGISDTPMTWQQFFLESALADWQNYAALAEEADACEYQLEQEYVDMLESLNERLTTDAGLRGFETAEEFFAYSVGAGATLDDYRIYMTTYYQGFMFFQSRYDAMIPTEEEIAAYFTEHEAEYAEQGINQTDYNVDVRHILVLPEGATVETIYNETFSEEAWAAGEQNANDILARWLEGDMTEESFAALANETSQDPGSNTNGGLYTDVYVGQMVEEFEAWCFDEARQVGDYGIVKTDLGYHIMYFSAYRYIWKDQVMSDIMADRGSSLIFEMTDKYPMTVDYSNITLGYVELNK